MALMINPQKGHPADAEAVNCRASSRSTNPLACDLLLTASHHSGRSFSSEVRFAKVSLWQARQRDILPIYKEGELVRQPYGHGLSGGKVPGGLVFGSCTSACQSQDVDGDVALAGSNCGVYAGRSHTDQRGNRSIRSPEMRTGAQTRWLRVRNVTPTIRKGGRPGKLGQDPPETRPGALEPTKRWAL